MSKILKKEDVNELREILRLANSYEMMRVHRFFDIDKLKKIAIKTGGMMFWKQAKKYHTQLQKQISKQKRLMRMALLYRWLRNFALALITILLPTFLIYPRSPNTVPSFLLVFLSPPFLLAFVILLWFVVFLRWYVNQSFVTFEKLESMNTHLMKIVQYYIDRIVASVKKLGLNPNDFKFKLFTDEYKNVKILKKPNFFRDFYLAIPDIRKKGD
jgi:hypothetical protein